MEELGIGRPSTYTAILPVLQGPRLCPAREQALIPEDKGRLVTAFLEAFFARYVEYDFTANLEEQLDRISAGEIDWKEVLREFWRDFSAALGEIKDLRISEVLDALNKLLAPHIFPAGEDGAPVRACPTCKAGAAVAQARQVRRLHRLLELSRMPLHPPARVIRRQRGQERDSGRRQAARR